MLLTWAVGGSDRVLAMGGLFVLDPFAVFVKVLLLAASAITAVMSLNYLDKEKLGRFEYPVLILLATTGMMMMVSANDFLSLYLGLEIQSLTLYVLAAYHRDSTKATESGLKYYVLGWLAAGMMLYGISLVYGFGHHLVRRLARSCSASTAPIPMSASSPAWCSCWPVWPSRCRRRRSICGPLTLHERGADPVTSVRGRRPQDRRHGAVGPVIMFGPFGEMSGAVASGGVVHRPGFHVRRLVRRHRPEQHQAPDGLFLHRPCRLHAGGHRRRFR